MNALVDGVTYLVTGDDAAGLFHGDTRHLSPISVVGPAEDLTLVDETDQPPFRRTRRYADVGTTINEISETVESKHATLLVTRRRTVREGRLVDRLELRNHDTAAQSAEVTLEFDADFADIFEVRNLREPTKRDVTTTVTDRSVTYRYEYADQSGDATVLETAVAFDPEPTTLEPGRASFELSLGTREPHVITAEVRPRGDESTVRASEGSNERRTGSVSDRPVAGSVDPFVVDGPLATGDPEYDRVFERVRGDLRALTTRSEHGPVPLAGAPWFVTVFGRDALLASYLLLPVAPSLARGTLRYLAAHQGAKRDERSDEAPGKIFHEIRRGELARSGAIPQVPYYGSIDATPLWVTLLHETWRWTGDDDLVTSLWGDLEAALDCLDRAVAATGDDPFLYYRTLGDGGVAHKVWRDSANGVQYADGGPAEPPLAGAAVQGYLYDALRRAAALADRVRDDETLQRDLNARAETVAARFDDAFWLPDRAYYATAVTGDGDRVDSVTSAVAHCLWSGLVPESRADDVVDRLLAPDLHTRWGLRTLSADEGGYSPLSYHAGGVWPHDNAVAALGLSRYGRSEAVADLVAGQLDALARVDGHGTPELYCGFDDVAAPVPFPSACRPQAWAAAAPYGFLRALFDLDPEGTRAAEATRRSEPVARSAIDPVLAYWQ